MRELLLVLLAAPIAAQETAAVTPQPSTDASLAALTLDELIERLPPAGAEWIRPETPAHEWRLVPVAKELSDRIEGGAALTSEQWKRALVSTGVLRLRDRWPASEPYAVSMRTAGWLSVTEVRLSPRTAGLQAAEVGLAGHSTCGTYMMQLQRAWKYQVLGPLPLGRQRLVFDLTLERGRPYRSAYVRRTSPVPAEHAPPAGIFFQGEIAFDVDIVPTLDDALPPRSSPELDAAVRSTLSLAFDDWSDGRVALLVADPDVANPLLAQLGLSLAIDVLHGEQVVESVVLVPSTYDHLATAISVHDAAEQPFAWALLRELPIALEHDERARAEWSVRVRGSAEHVLALWPATGYWNGTATLSLDELITRERAVAPDGRGPWIYMPTFR